MPSILSRFLGKKRNADQSPLLDGEKFEAVPRTTSPLSPTFGVSAQRTKSKEKEQDKGQGKRAKRSQAGAYDSHRAESVPVLSLSLPDAKDEEKKSQGLGVVFEGITDGPKTLDDAALGEKRLSPSETLILVQKTSEVLNERGLETLGVMRPHWFASPRQQEIQLKLIHRFLATLDSPKSNAEPSSPSPRSAFESELRYSRDPHDVAAVLRWGLRHLQLEGTSFGTPAAGDWYRTFTDSERSASYPTKAFDDILVPLLPPSHTNLLRATLDMVSSLAAHSEENGISGNKLSKVLGWWVVSSRNTQGGRWPEFYAQWEAAARQFEHLFLAYIRAQDAQSRMPKRLTELVKSYPFAKSRREEDGVYLPRSRFSTRSADALFVQVTVDKSTILSRPHPLRIVEDAFRAIADSETTTGVYATFWEEIRKVASQPGTKSRDEDADEAAPPLNLTTILADESIRLFSLVPTPDGTAAPTLSLFTPLPAGRGRRSLSVGERSPTSLVANGRAQSATRDSSSHAKSATSPQSSTQGSEVAPDWQAFSSAGFESPSGLSLAASLWDNDTEVSHPVSKKASTSKRPSRATSSRRRSADQPISARPVVETVKPAQRTYGAPRMVTLDEAFIDFWADSLLDSIARTWPTFVLCQLKPLPALKRTEDGKPIEWLVIECVSNEPKRSTPPPIKTSSASARAASPLPSPTKSDASKSKWTSSTMTATRKRFSFFSRNDTAPAAQGGRDRVAKKAAKDAKIGEMGEILREEDESVPNGVKANGAEKAQTPKKSVEKAQPAANHVNGMSKAEEPVVATPVKDSPRPEAAAVPAKPASEEPASKSNLLPIKETEVPKQPEPAAKEIMKPAPPSAVVEEVSKPQPVVEETKAESQPPQALVDLSGPSSAAIPAPVEVAAVAPAPVEAPNTSHAPVEPPIMTSAPVEAPTTAPALAEVPTMPPVPTAPAPVVPEAPTPQTDGPDAPELAPVAAPEPTPEAGVDVAPHVPAPADVPEVPVEPHHEAQSTTEAAPPVKTVEAVDQDASHVPEPEVHVPANTEPPREAEPEVVPPVAEVPTAEPPAPGPYVHHATIYIPPADENDLAQLRQPPISEDDELESSVQDESVHSPQPTEPEPALQESAEDGQGPAVTTEDAAKVDAVIQEVPEEEKGADEHHLEVAS